MTKNFNNYFIKSYDRNISFTNIPLKEDVLGFICPFLIENNKLKNKIALQIYERMHQFLIKLNSDYIKPNNVIDGINFLSHLHEPNEYHLGYSNTNKGKAVSNVKATEIFYALRNNRFAKQNIYVTNKAHFVLLLVKGIGQDIMSDIIANVCRDIFAEFTQKICNDYKIDSHPVKIEYYDAINKRWQDKTFNLPFYKGKYIILLPKIIVSGKRSYPNLYNWFIARNYISAEILKNKNPKTSDLKLIIQMKNGSKRAIIKKIYQVYKKPKEELIDFVLKFQGSIDEFVLYAKEHYPELDLDNSL